MERKYKIYFRIVINQIKYLVRPHSLLEIPIHSREGESVTILVRDVYIRMYMEVIQTSNHKTVLISYAFDHSYN